MTLIRVHKLGSKVGALLAAPYLAIALFGCGFPTLVERDALFEKLLAE